MKTIDSINSTGTLAIITVISLIACILINIKMRALWNEANFPSTVLQMQLSFSGSFLKQGYLEMISNGSIQSFRLWQIIDYAFMAAYGAFGISLSLLTGRLFKLESKEKNKCYYLATIMILVPLLDVFENAMSLTTLMNPLDFWDGLGILHSLFALIKWSLGLVSILAICGFWMKAFIAKLNKKSSLANQ